MWMFICGFWNHSERYNTAGRTVICYRLWSKQKYGPIFNNNMLNWKRRCNSLLFHLPNQTFRFKSSWYSLGTKAEMMDEQTLHKRTKRVKLFTYYCVYFWIINRTEYFILLKSHLEYSLKYRCRDGNDLL